MKPKVRIRHWQKGYKRVAHCGATHGSFRTATLELPTVPSVQTVPVGLDGTADFVWFVLTGFRHGAI